MFGFMADTESQHPCGSHEELTTSLMRPFFSSLASTNPSSGENLLRQFQTPTTKFILISNGSNK